MHQLEILELTKHNIWSKKRRKQTSSSLFVSVSHKTKYYILQSKGILVTDGMWIKA